MPSYAQEVKNELSRKLDDDRGCQLAEFVALIVTGSRKVDGRLEFSNINAAVARRVITLAKKFFPTLKPEVAAVRRKRLYKNLRYVVRFVATGEVQNFFDALDTAELLKRTRFKVAYLRGAFLAVGTVNRPESHYILQLILPTQVQAQFIRELMERLEFRAKLYERQKKFVTWISEADAICDFLGMLGAENAVERFEVARNLKEVRMQVNRIVNFETAALNKAIDAAKSQLADIKILLARNVTVNPKLQAAMTLRLENPACTVRELAEKIGMSAPGLLYRYHIINHLANNERRKMIHNKK